jgi:hypothetical protein
LSFDRSTRKRESRGDGGKRGVSQEHRSCCCCVHFRFFSSCVNGSTVWKDPLKRKESHTHTHTSNCQHTAAAAATPAKVLLYSFGSAFLTRFTGGLLQLLARIDTAQKSLDIYILSLSLSLTRTTTTKQLLTDSFSLSLSLIGFS